MNLVEVSEITKYFGGLRALYDISFNLQASKGEMVTMVGSNGSGKPTCSKMAG
jgi:ABC-type sugar transport system ATPase subunit